MFLNDDDYKAVCDDFEFETLQANTDLRTTAERAAMEQISSYTRNRYDMERAFRQTGDRPQSATRTVLRQHRSVAHGAPYASEYGYRAQRVPL